ncbi:MAG: TPM domain-containing protein [Candidatus Harrisonbacteria bacterium]|nr:TPM domain-containing protein [Candidatus Harrisonbacteria bacterium]
MKRVALAAGALIGFVNFVSALSIDVPKPAGYVNDFANVIPESAEKDLEKRLSDYEKQTAIEIAVVTVGSLQGLEVEEFAQELVSLPGWGIGKAWKHSAMKNTGLLLLIAPNERRMRIHTGYGMEEWLPDALSARIINDELVPRFKQGKMSEGITAGVGAMIRELGNKPMAVREEELAATEAKRLREERLAQEHRAFVVKYTFIVVTVLAGVLLVGFIAIARYRRQRRLKEQYQKNVKLLEKCESEIERLRSDQSETEVLLGAFKSEHPQEVWDPLVQRIAGVHDSLMAFQKRGDKIKSEHSNGSYEDADTIKTKVEGVSADLHAAIKLLGSVKSDVAKVRKAQKDAQHLLEDLPRQAGALRNKLNHQDVSSETRELLKKSEADYEKTRFRCQNESVNKLNWLKAATALVAVEVALRNITEAAEKEIASAVKGRALLKSLPDVLDAMQKTVDHEDVSDMTRKKAGEGEQDYERARSACQNEMGNGLNWVTALAALIAAERFMNSVNDAGEKEIAYAAEARREGPKLIRNYPESITRLERIVSHNDVTRNTKSMVGDVKKEYQKVQKMTERTPIDWVVVYPVLLGLESLIADVVKRAESDKDAARRRRAEEARRQREEEEEEERARESSYSSGYSSGSSWSSGSSFGSSGGSSSGSSGGGSSFGGFGGGSFGGGGASGSW